MFAINRTIAFCDCLRLFAIVRLFAIISKCAMLRELGAEVLPLPYVTIYFHKAGYVARPTSTNLSDEHTEELVSFKY